MNPQRNPSSKQPLNDQQQFHLLNNFFLKQGGTRYLCRNHIKSYGNFGNSKYSKLVNLARRPPDWAPPVYDQPKKRHKPNSKTKPVLRHFKKWLKKNTHPLPDAEPIRVFFSDYPSYRKIYAFYRSEHPKDSEFFLSWTTFRRWRKTKFPWIKKPQKTKAACDTCCKYWLAVQCFNKWKGHTIDLTSCKNIRT